MKKRLFLALLLLSLCAAVLLLSACNSGGSKANVETDPKTGLRFRENIDGTYTVAGAKDNKATEISIPATFKEKPVTTIGYGAFKNFGALEKISIPDSVTSIGKHAFEECKNLTQVTLGEQSNLQTLGERAFYGCAYLRAFAMPQKLSSLGAYAFYGCASLEEIAFPAQSRLTDVSTFAFAYCFSLESVSFGQGSRLLAISPSAFLECKSLESVTFGEGCAPTTIGAEAFAECAKLSFINMPSSMRQIGEKAFYNCLSLLSITLPQGLSAIGDAAFSGCYKLVEVYNLSPLAVVRGNTDFGHVGAYAFDVYASKSEPSKLFVDEGGFTFYENGANCRLLSYNGGQTDISLPSSCGGKSYAVYRYAFYGRAELSSVTLSENITALGDFAFAYCTKLKEIRLPASVESLGWYVFAYNGALQEVRFAPECAIAEISSAAFTGCESLAEISIPESVSSIGFSAFAGCKSLESVLIGENIKSLGRGAFEGCLGIKEIHFEAAYVSYCGADVFLNAGTKDAGIAAFIDKDVQILPDYLFSGAQNVSSVNFEAEAVCERIGEGAFLNCSSLSSIVIPQGIRQIGKKAFAGCTALSTVELYAKAIEDLSSDAFAFENAGTKGTGICVAVANGVAQIPAYLFGAKQSFAAPKIKSVIFSEDSLCTYIGDGAFAYLPSLTSFEAPSAIKRVGVGVFAGSESLRLQAYDNAYYIGNEENPHLILLKVKGASVTSCQIHTDTAVIAGEAFASCGKLESIVLPSALVGIGEGAFKGCRALSQIAIPDALESVGASAFADCTALHTVTFTAQSNLKEIGKNAFARCITLQKFVIPLAVETMGAEVFTECASLVIYCKAAQRPSGWNVFWNGSGGTVYWAYSGV